MSWFQSEIKHRHILMLYNLQRYSIQSQSFPQNPPPTPPLSSNAETSPAMLFIIVILAIIFFISGLLHLLARFIMRHRPSSSDIPSNQNPDMSNSRTFQRQLHHLFNLHDSGLDQEFIDALPVFQYKEILGLKEPFDCAICLCEFSEHDNLRLLPLCSHAFHVECIDKWLLSNSTCPLCRGALFTPGLDTENPVLDVKDWREESGGITIGSKPNEVEIVFEKKKVFPVILGKFRSSIDEGNRDDGESSNNFDVRRCFSMGSYQYVVADSELQVALSSNRIEEHGDPRIFEFSVDGDVKGKRISAVSKNDSFSVSKIWLWSKKDKFCGSSNIHVSGHSSVTSVDMRLPWNNVA